MPSPGRGRRATRVLVCIDDGMRAARRWCAMPGGRPTGCARRGRRSMSRPPRDAACREAEQGPRWRPTLRLAEQLGGEAVTLPGARRRRRDPRAMRSGQQRHPHRHRQARPSRAGANWFDGSVTHDLIRQAGDISVHVISGDARRRRCREREPSSTPAQTQLLVPALSAAAAYRRASRSASACCCARCWTSRNMALVFLMAVLASAVTLGPVAGAVRLAARRAGLQLLLPAHRSTPSRSAIRKA